MQFPNFDDYNLFYSFIRTSVIHFYDKCCDNSDNRYYSRFLDDGLKLDDYLEFLEIMFLHLYDEDNKR